MGIREQMESIYRELAPDRIPWNLEEPPELLVDLVVGPMQHVDGLP